MYEGWLKSNNEYLRAYIIYICRLGMYRMYVCVYRVELSVRVIHRVVSVLVRSISRCVRTYACTTYIYTLYTCKYVCVIVYTRVCMHVKCIFIVFCRVYNSKQHWNM